LDRFFRNEFRFAGPAGASTVSTEAEPPLPAASNDVPRTVMTFLASED
jgi:hypothetical protein